MSELTLTEVGVDHGAGTPWETPGVTQVNLALHGGDRVLVVGGNGSGKSTLTSVLAGLITPTRGTALLDGIAISSQSDRVTLVVQHTRLQLMRPTVAEELEELSSDGLSIVPVVNQLGLSSLLSRRIDELSGGQQRRVGLAGALLRSTPLVLLDEPMAGLDRAARADLVDALTSLPLFSIVVVVTHDYEASRPILTQGRRGRLLRIDAGRLTEIDTTDPEASPLQPSATQDRTTVPNSDS